MVRGTAGSWSPTGAPNMGGGFYGQPHSSLLWFRIHLSTLVILDKGVSLIHMRGFGGGVGTQIRGGGGGGYSGGGGSSYAPYQGGGGSSYNSVQINLSK